MSQAASFQESEHPGMPEAVDPAVECGRPVPADALVRSLPIVNKRGLHARASAKFVQVASSFDACIQVERDGVRVGGTSIMGLMMLAAAPGTTIEVEAAGPEAQAALDALDALVADRFGEGE